LDRRKLRILTVSAHPHDWTWFSGTMGIHAASGDHVTVCVVTHGGTTHRELYLDELRKPEEDRDPAIINESVEDYIEQKAKEMRKAAALFGVTDVRMLNFPDKPFTLQEYPEVVDQLADLVREVRPDILITESPFTDDLRPIAHRSDHTEVGRAALEAKEQAGFPRLGVDRSPHNVPLTYWPGEVFDRSQLDFVVELSPELFEKRVQAEAFYESQGHDPELARSRLMVEVGAMGRHLRTSYGEGFVRERPDLVARLPAPELMLQQAEEDYDARKRRLTGKAGSRQ
jgi:LmbE family N-acetylglucosaminyl deacetylase